MTVYNLQRDLERADMLHAFHIVSAADEAFSESV